MPFRALLYMGNIVISSSSMVIFPRFGFIKPKKQVLFDNKGKVLIQNQELLKSKELTEGKAMQQKSYQDFLAR